MKPRRKGRGRGEATGSCRPYEGVRMSPSPSGPFNVRPFVERSDERSRFSLPRNYRAWHTVAGGISGPHTSEQCDTGGYKRRNNRGKRDAARRRG